jgi:hypothetical protein
VSRQHNPNINLSAKKGAKKAIKSILRLWNAPYPVHRKLPEEDRDNQNYPCEINGFLHASSPSTEITHNPPQ